MIEEAKITAINEFNSLKEDLIKKHLQLGMKASGRWINNLEVVTDRMSIKLLGEHYTRYLVNGRKPGKMPPVKVIEQWIKDKGLQTRLPISTLAWAIAMSIKKKGTKYYPEGTDLLDAVITPQRIQSIIDKVGESVLIEATTIFKNETFKIAV